MELGVGQSIAAKRLSVARLVDAIQTVTQNPAIAGRAASLVGDLKIAGFEQRLLDAVARSLAR